jgi:hypothetical protein
MIIVDRSYDPAIALQLMQGSYNGQQRPLTSKMDTKFHIVCVQILFSGNTNNLVRKTKSGTRGIFGIFAERARRQQGGKSNTLIIEALYSSNSLHMFVFRKVLVLPAYACG